MKKDKSKKSSKINRKAQKQLLRIEELQQVLKDGNGEMDPQMILSMYLPNRKRKKLASSLLKIDRLQLILLSMLLAVAVLFITAFMQEKMGNFTINLNRLELYRKGVNIADNGDFDESTSRLSANSVEDATNISIDDLPVNLSELEGDNNGSNYMSYTYFIRNAGKEDVDYAAQVRIENTSKGAEEAVRVAVWKNDEQIVYAAPSANGEAEDGCENFYSESIVCNYTEENFRVGDVDKYTVVIWLEGDDPECVDKIIGGSVELSMYIDAITGEDENLFTWFVEDVKDFLTGNDPISAAGEDAPNYYDNEEITYENRRNQ